MQKGIFRPPAVVIVFSIITLGIYYLYWTYTVGRELKDYLGKQDINPGIDLLLCIFCTPYSIYWNYKYGKLIFEAQHKAALQVKNDESVLCLILSLCCLHVVAMAILQSNLNRVWEAGAPAY